MRRTSVFVIIAFLAGLGIGYFARSTMGTLQQRYMHKADLAAIEKLHQKNADLIVSNPLETMNSPTITATLLWPDGRTEELPSRTKPALADILLQRATDLFK